MSDRQNRTDQDTDFNRARGWRDRDGPQASPDSGDRLSGDRPSGDRPSGDNLSGRPALGDRFGERERSYGRSQSDPGGYGYGDGGDTPYGQVTRGGSDKASGGFGGPGAGGFGQQTLNSQWGQGGYGPLTQGANYGQGGSQFGPAGYGVREYGGGFGQSGRDDGARREPGRGSGPAAAGPPAHHDESYHRWHDTQMDSHDRDYGLWRSEQARRYDEEYSSWRNDRHTAFGKEFDSWRAGRSGQPAAQPGQTGSAHGANPALGDIADGGYGAGRHEARHVAQEQKHHDDHAKAEARPEPARTDVAPGDNAKH